MRMAMSFRVPISLWARIEDDDEQDTFSTDEKKTPELSDKGKIPYLIGWFDSRHSTGRQDQEGYHVYRWNNSKNTLEEPDKWEPGSAAAQVYAHFKQHGAVNVSETGSDRIAQFTL